MMHHGSIARCSSVHSCLSVIHVSIHFLCLQLQCVQEVNEHGGSHSVGGSTSSTLQVVDIEAETTGPPAKALPTNARPPPPPVHTQPAAAAASTVQPPQNQPPPAAPTDPAPTEPPPPVHTQPATESPQCQPPQNQPPVTTEPVTTEPEPVTTEPAQHDQPPVLEPEQHDQPPVLEPAQLALPDVLPIPPLLPLETTTEAGAAPENAEPAGTDESIQ